MGYRYDSSEAEDDFGMQKEPQRVEVIPDELKSVLLEVMGFLRFVVDADVANRGEARDLQDKLTPYTMTDEIKQLLTDVKPILTQIIRQHPYIITNDTRTQATQMSKRCGEIAQQHRMTLDSRLWVTLLDISTYLKIVVSNTKYSRIEAEYLIEKIDRLLT